MRIIAGALRGRTLKTLAGEATRPTSALVRGAIANLLGPRIAGARVLDLYAGSGAIAFELLSRGAARATLVEQAPEALRIIEANRAALGLSEQTILVRGEVSAQLSRLTGPFDVVVADPPYRTADWEALLAAIAPLLAPEGVALFEHTRGESLPTEGAGWLLARTYAYGATLVARYERPAPPGS